MNAGKQFEQDIKKSIKDMWVYRFKDGTGGFSGQKNENVRFQASNICDFLLYEKGQLYLLELKTHMGKSIPFSAIRENQVKELEVAAKAGQGIKSLFILNFREVEKTYVIEAIKVKEYIDRQERKSIPIGWVEDNGVLIEQRKKIKRYTYQIEKAVRGI